MALGFASCEDTSDLGIAQVNPQEPIFSSADIVYTPEATLDANVYDSKTASFIINDMPEGYVLTGATMTLSNTEDFAKTIEVPLTISGENLLVNTDEIGRLYYENFTKSPDKVNLYAKTVLSAAKGTQSVQFNPLTASYEFIPFPAPVLISPAYYVVLGNGSEWDVAGAVKMNHADVSQYDDPNFSIVITEGAAPNDKWVILSQDSYDKAKAASSIASVECLVPVLDPISISGDLEKTEGSKINVATLPSLQFPASVEINGEYLTYTSKLAIEKFYATGNGWSNWSTHWMPLSTTNYIEYYGFLNLESEFKFAPQAGWGNDFGSSAALDASENGGVYNYSGILNRASDNIKIDHAGLYFACLKSTDWSLSLNGINSWGIIGDFPDNSWSSDVATLTPSADLYTWTGEVTVGDGIEWKFRANGDWAVNLGGTPDELWKNGDNITLPAGTYTITLDLSTYPSKFTAVKK